MRFVWRLFEKIFSPVFKQNSRHYESAAVLSWRNELWVLIYHKNKKVFYITPSYDGTHFILAFKKRIHFRGVRGEDRDLSEISSFSFAIYDQKKFVSYQLMKKGKKETVLAEAKKGFIFHETKILDSEDGLTPLLLKNEDIMSLHGYGELKLEDQIVLQPRGDSFDNSALRPLALNRIHEGILVLFESTFLLGGAQSVFISVALLEHDDPYSFIWRSPRPLLDEFRSAQQPFLNILSVALVNNIYHILGSSGNDSEIEIFSFPQPYTTLNPIETSLKLERCDHANPIIDPRAHPEWGAIATLNPAAFELDEKVHLLYRAQGPSWVSVLGHCTSDDGISFERSTELPVYAPSIHKEGYALPPSWNTSRFVSGPAGPWGSEGCEDPRATILGDRLYVLYAAFNGWEQARLAMTSVDIESIRDGTWQWNSPALLSQRPTVFGTGVKSGALFPEKINGKYVLMYRYWPNICIDYLDELDFYSPHRWVRCHQEIKIRPAYWDSGKIGAGAPPIKTEEGWLLIYQGMGEQDQKSEYKMGAMLLDLEDPGKILYRSSYPILVPDREYENVGIRHGVAYPCGAVVRDGMLYVYYGGADKYACVATTPLNIFISELKKGQIINQERRFLTLA